MSETQAKMALATQQRKQLAKQFPLTLHLVAQNLQ
jgi:hypothetical protein